MTDYTTGPFPGGDKTMPIAIVGIGGRFPGDASNPDKLWDLLAQKRSARSAIPKDRYNIDAFYHPHAERAGAQNFTTAHFMNREPDAFDAPFFQLLPNEVKAMDPQQRMCLEVAYEALENAGIRIEDIVKSQTAVFTGCFTADYKDMMSHDTDNLPAYFPTGVAPSCLSNRVSWFYDLRGPSMTVDTACSSSLIALHLACQALRTGEADMSLVGGVNFMCSPEYNYTMSQLHFLTPDGKCQSFDEKGNGYARGEGCSFIIIKPLEQALKDNDTIRAVIRNTGANQDGKTPGITLPSAEAQAALIRSTYSRAGLGFDETGYFEAHGTGTAAGDPIETSALGVTFGAARPIGHPLWVGSIKANIGHLEGASGLAGLTKALYVLEKGQIPPQVWLDKVNPRILTDEWNLAFPRELTPWPYPGLRRVSINSFGFGGANAHCIMDDAYHYLRLRGLKGNHNTTVEASGPGTPDTGSSDSAISLASPQDQGLDPLNASDIWNSIQAKFAQTRPQLLVLSSHEQAGITRTTQSLSTYLKEKLEATDPSEHTDILYNFAYSIGPRRSVLPWKTFAVASSLDEACQSVSEVVKAIRSSRAPKIGFVFTGQGAQHYSMGRELWTYPVYADSLQAADAHLTKLGCTWSVVEELWKDGATSHIDNPTFSQPLCTVVQVGLVELLHSWGITPAAVVGHSSGEIAAAFAKGAITREDAWTIAYHRGRLSSMIGILAPNLSGRMLAAGVGEEVAQKYLSQVTQGRANVACINSPSSVTISGDSSAVDQVEELLKKDELFARKLKVATAYHSFHMEVIGQQYLEALAGLQPLAEAEGGPKMFSSVTGSSIDNSSLGAQYWVDNMLNVVRFAGAVGQLIQHSDNPKRRRATGKPYVDVLIEIGPHGALQGPVKQILGEQADKCKVISALSRGKNCAQTALEAVGNLFQMAYPVDLETVNNCDAGKRELLVDIPPYAWNHSNKYWCETAMAAGYRFRKTPRNDLLGTLNPESNQSEPSWRHHFRLSENPWIEDHSVHNTLLYPAAGMMVMALEAASEIADVTKEVDGYELKDVLVGKALIVPRDEDGVETMLHLRPWRMGSQSETAAWNEFTIYSRPGKEEWSLNCSGLLRVVYKQNDSNPIFQNEVATKNSFHRQRYQQAKRESTTEQSGKSFYDHQRKIGLQLGITFCNLFEINKGDGQSACAVRIPDMASTMPMKYITKHVIHPCTLDAIIQTLLPTVEGRYENLKTAAIPTFIEKLFVSADAPAQPGAIFQTYSVAGYTGLTEAEASVYASVEGWEKPLVVFERIRATRLASLTDNLSGELNARNLRKIAGEFVWMEDVSDMTPKQIADYCAANSNMTAENPSRASFEHIEKSALSIYAKRAVAAVSAEKATELEPHLGALYQSLQAVCEQDVAEHPTDAEQTLAQLASSLSSIGESLPDILHGKVQPRAVLQQTELSSVLDATGIALNAAHAQLAAYLTLLGHCFPGMKILEIGNGSNSIIKTAVNALVHSSDSTPWFKSYTYTGISNEPSAEVSTILSNQGTHMSYKQLDICKDPIQQGLQKHDYDLVIASDLSQTASLLEEALQFISEIVKPSGTVVLGEATKQSDWRSLIFAMLGDGTFRTAHPEVFWSEVVSKSGFAGIDFKLPASPIERQEESDFTFFAIKPDVSTKREISSDVLLVQGNAPPTVEEVSLVAQLTARMRSMGAAVSTTALGDIADINLKDKACVMLADLLHPILFHLSPADFEAIRTMTLQAASTTWLTRGATIKCDNPKASLITGLARTIRQESVGVKLSTLDLDPAESIDAPSAVDAVVQALLNHSVEGHDQEYAVRSGVFMTPRVHLNKGANDLIATHNVEATPEPGCFKQEGRALTLSVGTPGMLDSLYFKDDETWPQPLKEKEIEIEVKASGLNFMDIMVAMDQIQEPAIGLECSGVVTRTGSAASKFQPGDRVMTWLLGGFSNYARNDESMFQRIPDSMSFETAASLPMIYSTAYQSLVEEARLTKEDKVLIHAAAGGVGQASIMIAQSVGAEIFATVGSQEKKDHIMKLYGISEDHIFNSRDLSFVQGIRRMTNDKGVDVILNSLAGEALRESWQCLAWFGRFIELGKKDITGNTGLEMAPFLRNQSFHAVNVIGTLRASVPRAARMFEGAMRFFESAQCKAVTPLTVMGFDQVEAGFRALQSGKNMGKIVFKAEDAAVVQAIPHKVHEAEFRPDVTYVLSGGLGGLGRSLVAFFVSHGAKNLAFLSRSGTKRPEAQAQIDALLAQGINAKAYACDIGNAEQVMRVARQIQDDMPRIRGVIQAAMSLADAAYTNMTPEQWTLSVNPKAPGTWNLHEHMPKDLDFFVLLASSSGAAGNRGQANYAAGNTFQDALAHHRRSQGMAATAIDVGPVLGAGHVAENPELIASLAAQGYTALREEEFVSLIQAGITGVTVTGEPTPVQLVTGFATGGLVAAEGWEMPYYLEDPKMRHLVLVDAHGGSDGPEAVAGLASQIADITSVGAGADLVAGALTQKLAKLMMVSPDDIDVGKAVSTYGVDSLTAVEIRAWGFRELQSDVSIFDIMSNVPITTLARMIVSKSKLVAKEVVAADA